MSDTGLADPRLARALAALPRPDAPDARGQVHAARAEALAALAGARVFAAVTAVRTAEHVDPATGLRVDAAAEMVLLSLVGSAGGRAVPLFLDAAGAVAFRSGARPVPLPGPEACAAALEDGAVAVLLDPPGAALAVTGGDLQELAQGRVPVAGAPLSARRTTAALDTPRHADPALLQALGDVLRDEPVRAARLLQSPDGPVLGLVPDAPLDAGALAALAARVLPGLPVADVAVAVVAPDGPGLPVPLPERSERPEHPGRPERPERPERPAPPAPLRRSLRDRLRGRPGAGSPGEVRPGR